MSISPGLYLVATPIGNAEDITLRALRVLREADALAAEDTRQARKLMDIHGIPLSGRPLLPYHDHNGPQARPGLLKRLEDGQSLAYVSDAGTPLIADPGFRLAQEAIARDLPVVAVPGASAVLAALGVAGLPTDCFFFAGFLPPKSAARRTALEALKPVPGTLVFYESPRRLAAALADMAAVMGGEPAASVSRELTKRFEETRRGSLADLAVAYAGEAAPKGEVVVLIGPAAQTETSADDLDDALSRAMEGQSLKDAVAEVTKETGLPRKRVYARALELAEK